MKKLLLTIAVLLSLTVAADDYQKYYEALPTPVKAVVPVVIPQNVVNLKDCGAVGDGFTLCTEAFQKGISQLTKLGGGRLVIPEGVWLTGPIVLKDNIELHLAKNAIIYFSPDKSLYVAPTPAATTAGAAPTPAVSTAGSFCFM